MVILDGQGSDAMRDDFSAKTKEILAKRAGYCCSFPNCDQRTIGPSDEQPSGTSSIGMACHISAASSGPGARRYDANLTSEERKAIDNGIWMCANHGKLIDTDETTYTIEQLKAWKVDAERLAKSRLEQAADPSTPLRFWGVATVLSLIFVGGLLWVVLNKRPICLLNDAWVDKTGTTLTRDGLKITMTRSHTSSAPQNVSFRLSGPTRDLGQKTLTPEGGGPEQLFLYRGVYYVVSTSFIDNERARFTVVQKGKKCP